MESAEQITRELVNQTYCKHQNSSDREHYHRLIIKALTSYRNAALDEAVNIAACAFRGVYDGENDHAKLCYLEMRKAIVSLKSKEPS